MYYPISHFQSFGNKSPDAPLTSKCLTCRYIKNLRNKNNRDKINKYLDTFKVKGCANPLCKETRIEWMEIDHIDPLTKSICVTQGHPSMKLVKKEMEVCQVLCYPCHKVKTAKDRVVIVAWKKNNTQLQLM